MIKILFSTSRHDKKQGLYGEYNKENPQIARVFMGGSDTKSAIELMCNYCYGDIMTGLRKIRVISIVES